MTRLGRTGTTGPGRRPESARSGWWRALTVYALLLGFAAVVVVVTGEPTGVAIAVSPLLPVAWWLLGHDRRPEPDSGA